jgi:acyl-CoA synthetase (AMP-forming)/AMP-acid ligase II
MQTLFQLICEAYSQVPDQSSVYLLQRSQPDQVMTYRDLLEGAAGYAQALEESGVGQGEVVILILQHSEALIHAFFGAVLQGVIPAIMPFLSEKLSPDKYRESLTTLFEITAPAVVITQLEFMETVFQAMEPGTPVQSVLLVEDIHPVPGVDPSGLPGNQRQPEDIVLLQHSSGTTGLQKGVALSHRAVFNQLKNYQAAIYLQEDDVIISWLPLYHDMGLIAGFLMPILCRVTLVLMSPFDWVRAPYLLMQAIARFRGTLSWLPNFAYNFCAQKIQDRDLVGVDLSSWRAVINCSEPMYNRSHQLFLERFKPYGLHPEALATCYAMAENVFAVTQGGIVTPSTIDLISQRAFQEEHVAIPPSGDEETLSMLSAGYPIPNTQVRVIDKTRKDLPERHIGEIAIHSDCVLSSYYNRPDLTEKAFHDGWYLTGDLGYQADGELYITGRNKDLIIVGGKNIYPRDLEQLASEVPGVHPGRVVAFGIFNERTGTEDIVLLAEDDNLNTAEHAQIANYIRQAVTQGSDVALRYVHLVERGWLIKTSSGKIARKANQEKYYESGIGRQAGSKS